MESKKEEKRRFSASLRTMGAIASFALLGTSAGACGGGFGGPKGEAPQTVGEYKDWRAICNGKKPHEVKDGETVFTILKAVGGTTLNGNNLTWEDLPVQAVFDPVKELNPGLDNIDHIEAGDTLYIPEICSADQTSQG